jgi:7-alpha-hydroxysteroid dehydrogenase
MCDAANFRLDEAVALITGAGAGIGLAIAIAESSASAAAAVTVTDRDAATPPREKSGLGPGIRI